MASGRWANWILRARRMGVPTSDCCAALCAALLAAALSTSGCQLFQRKQVRTFVPPPVQHKAPEPLKLASVEPPELPPVESNLGFDTAELSPSVMLAPPPPPPEAPRPRPPVATAPKPTPAPVAPEAPAPKIVQIFPAEQQRAYNRELDEILERDQKALELLARRNLAADQRERMAQIRELLTQAKQAREQDLVTAVNLARRADTLANDLLDPPALTKKPGLANQFPPSASLRRGKCGGPVLSCCRT